MSDILKWGTFLFTGIGGNLAAIAPIFPNPSMTTILVAGAACAALWAGLCQHPPWLVNNTTTTTTTTIPVVTGTTAVVPAKV